MSMSMSMSVSQVRKWRHAIVSRLGACVRSAAGCTTFKVSCTRRDSSPAPEERPQRALR